MNADTAGSERNPRGMVVGVDGGQPSTDALAWAAGHTDLFGPVRPVHAWDYPISVWAPSPFGPGAAPPIKEMEAAAIEAAATCIESLGEVPHDEPQVFQGEAGHILVEASPDARLLVVGTRGRGPVRSNVIGSVSRHCADHSAVPVVIVPHLDPPISPAPGREKIVVGVDGSDHSITALRWAVENARTESEIVAIASWQTPIDGPILYGVNRFDLRALKAAAHTTVNEAADKVCAEIGVDGGRVIREIAEGDPRWVLMSRAETADLLVLGQRGRTGLPHLFLGSTTTALIHRPHCPTAVIPG